MINLIAQMKWMGIFMMMFVFACSQKTQEERLKSYVDDPGNKVTQTITIGDVSMVAKYLPAPYRSLMRNDSTMDEAERFYYFDIKIDKKAGDKPEKEKVLYLNFNIQNDFVLLANNKDSIMPSICQKIEN